MTTCHNLWDLGCELYYLCCGLEIVPLEEAGCCALQTAYNGKSQNNHEIIIYLPDPEEMKAYRLGSWMLILRSLHAFVLQ